MRILATAKMQGPAQALVAPIEELLRRGHLVDVYATGNEAERKGFQKLPYQAITPSSAEDCRHLVRDYDLVLTGLSGHQTPDGFFVRAAVHELRPVISVADQNCFYTNRLESNPDALPTKIALMSEACLSTLQREMGNEGEEAVRRSVVVGWTAFDGYAAKRARWTETGRETLFRSLHLDPEIPWHVHFTQNIPAESEYMRRVTQFTAAEKAARFAYELAVTRNVLSVAAQLKIPLIVKPHPGEADERNFTQEAAKDYDAMYVPATACNSQELMLAASSVSAGRSTCLTESCLLDRNTGGVFPDLPDKELEPFPAVTSRAIPFTQEWGDIGVVLQEITSKHPDGQLFLAQRRKRFSVDGKASSRLADLVEEFA